MVRVVVVTHDNGEQIPVLLNSDDMPIVLPNEFILTRRHLSTNTMVRNIRELAVLFGWFASNGYDFSNKLSNDFSFSEAQINTGLIEYIRAKDSELGFGAVSPNTFNQRLTTIRKFLVWCMDIKISQLPFSSSKLDCLRERKKLFLHILDNNFMSPPPIKSSLKKGLNDAEYKALLEIIDPELDGLNHKSKAVRYRNYISVGLMLFCGLRPGELLSLQVIDIQIGAISSVTVERRVPDIKDTRRPKPKIKRNGRVIPIDNSKFLWVLNEYIVSWRQILEEYSDHESEYLILSDEGKPLSQSSITQYFRHLREKFADVLPNNLTAKSLRHTFSSRVERALRASGIDEQKRREALAFLRGDSSLYSQDIYIAQEVEDQARESLKIYQERMFQL